MFKASKSVPETERVMNFFNDIMAQQENESESQGATSFGPVPPHFSDARRQSTTDVLDPKKKISKGASSLQKRWKEYPELWRTN